MKVGLAIYNILSGDSNIEEIVGTRIFPNVARENTSFPFILYTVLSDSPTEVKEMTSPLDVTSVMVSCYSETYTQACDLAMFIRNALQRKAEGTYGTIKLRSITYEGYNDIFDDDAGTNGIFTKALDFSVQIINE
jgi:hypothetical protein